MEEGSAEDGGSGGRLTHAQVMRSTLVSIGTNETLDQDLDYAAEVLRRAVSQIKAFERRLNLDEVAEKEKLKAVLALNAMYALEKKFQADDDREDGGAGPSAPEYPDEY